MNLSEAFSNFALLPSCTLSSNLRLHFVFYPYYSTQILPSLHSTPPPLRVSRPLTSIDSENFDVRPVAHLSLSSSDIPHLVI